MFSYCTGFFGRPDSVFDINGVPPPVPDFPYKDLARSVASSVHRQDYIEPRKTFVDSGTQVGHWLFKQSKIRLFSGE